MRRVAQAQKTITNSFESSASYWQGVYDENSFLGSVYRERQAAALAWIDEFGLPAGSRVLEIGCGAGFLTVAVAARGYRVESIDSSEAMVAATRARMANSQMVGTPGAVHPNGNLVAWQSRTEPIGISRPAWGRVEAGNPMSSL